MIIGGVFDLADDAIWLHQRVEPVDNVTVARLMLGLLIAGVGICYRVREVVLGVSLKKWINKK